MSSLDRAELIMELGEEVQSSFENSAEPVVSTDVCDSNQLTPPKSVSTAQSKSFHAKLALRMQQLSIGNLKSDERSSFTMKSRVLNRRKLSRASFEVLTPSMTPRAQSIEKSSYSQSPVKASYEQPDGLKGQSLMHMERLELKLRENEEKRRDLEVKFEELKTKHIHMEKGLMHSLYTQREGEPRTAAEDLRETARRLAEEVAGLKDRISRL
jgi:hypothetical protein